MKVRILLGTVCMSVIAGFASALLLVSGGVARVDATASAGNGDVNGDGSIDIGDAVYLLSHLFGGGPAPVPFLDMQLCQEHLAPCQDDLQARDAEVLALQAQLADYQSMLAECQGILAQCQSELAATWHLYLENQSALAQCSADLAACNAQVTALETQLAASEAHRLALQDELALCQGILADCETAAAQCYTSLVECQASLAAAEALHGECRSDLAQTQSDLEAREAEAAALESELALCLADLHECRVDLEECRALPPPPGGPLPATGQTYCYGSEGYVDCWDPEWPGQDGFYQKGCPMDDRYVENGDGTVTDHSTELMWQRHLWPQSCDWQDALHYCEHLDYAGYTDWRLPNVWELMSIVHYGYWEPAIHSALRPAFCMAWGFCEPSHWSSTTVAGDPGSAWVVEYYNGSPLAYHKSSSASPLCVRDAGAGSPWARPPVGSLPATGQTICYDSAGEVIDCMDPFWPGQDGFYQRGCPMEGRFVDNGDGTVTDTGTGLMWQKDTADMNGDGDITEADQVVWQDALLYCEYLELAGHRNWRLPNARELQSLVDYGSYAPAIASLFDAAPGRYWSSTSLGAYGGVTAWSADFGAGDVKAWCAKTSGPWPWPAALNYVRAVRDARPDSRFVDNGDGTVTDIHTGHMWQKGTADVDGDGDITGADCLDWQDALMYCESLDFAGYGDWRLPNVDELRSIADHRRYYSPSGPVLTGISSGYWSSSASGIFPDSAWVVWFDSGYVHHSTTTNVHPVRAVRGWP